MFIWATIVKHAKSAGLPRVLCVFFIVQCALTIPIGIVLLRDRPAVFYPRIHGGPDWEGFDKSWVEYIEVDENESGFIQDIRKTTAGEHASVFDNFENGSLFRVILAPTHEGIIDFDTPERNYTFVITPEYILYRDANASLAVPAGLVSAWAVREGALEEIFDHLALYNRFFSSIFAPVFILMFVVFFAMQVLMCFAIVWLLGYWQKLSGNMTVRERFAVCTFASVPAGALGFALGIIFPIAHIFLFQLGMLFFTYKSMKEYFNAQSRLVEQVL
jgi:hypothetical protein